EILAPAEEVTTDEVSAAAPVESEERVEPVAEPPAGLAVEPWTESPGAAATAVAAPETPETPDRPDSVEPPAGEGWEHDEIRPAAEPYVLYPESRQSESLPSEPGEWTQPPEPAAFLQPAGGPAAADEMPAAGAPQEPPEHAPVTPPTEPDAPAAPAAPAVPF